MPRNVAIAKIVVRDKQHLACVRPGKRVLLLETMYYADELRLPEDMPSPRLHDAETKMAISLIENLTAKWTPGKYHDQYRNELLDLLTKKAEGEPLPAPSSEATTGELDLMDALRQSVQATKRKSATGTKRSGASTKQAASPRKRARKGSPRD